MNFVRDEQLARDQEQVDGARGSLRSIDEDRFADCGGAVLKRDGELSLLQFALLLLNPVNDTVDSTREPNLDGPLAHYYTACSHNSYIVGDQLTGLSSADMYRRQLLLGLRHVEIDCWNGVKNSPIVTHGHTFCTTVSFVEVARAVEECAFVNCELPVILSLEMHCNVSQRFALATMLTEHLDDKLLTYDLLVETGRATSLSPLDLAKKILVKGKVVVQRGRKGKEKASEKKERASMTAANLQRSISQDEEDIPGRSSRRLSRNGMAKSVMQIDLGSSASSRRSSGIGSRRMRGANSKLSSLHSSKRMKEDSGASNKSFATLFEYDVLYHSVLSFRSEPLQRFLASDPSVWELPITSASEEKFLKALCLPALERDQIVGLVSGRTTQVAGGRRSSISENPEQVMSRAIVRIAANPPAGVGVMQRRTASWALRPFPLGLRFSGANMTPLPCWLSGAQHVCLNFSDNDLAVQLHFALFNGSGSFVLKPLEMRPVLPQQTKSAQSQRESHEPTSSCRRATRMSSSGVSSSTVGSSSTLLSAHEPQDAIGSHERKTPRLFSSASGSSRTLLSARESHDALRAHTPRNEHDYWPPPRETLRCVVVELVSLHLLPKRGERRPQYCGRRSGSHKYHPELSGAAAPPDDSDPSNVQLSVVLHPIGGVCAVSNTLPLPGIIETETTVTPPRRRGGGLSVPFGESVYCVAAEPHSTFLRVGVIDGGHEVAYETAVLGRLRGGYRVLRLRGLLGTRIELCFLFVHLSFASEANLWLSPRQLRLLHARDTDVSCRGNRPVSTTSIRDE